MGLGLWFNVIGVLSAFGSAALYWIDHRDIIECISKDDDVDKDGGLIEEGRFWTCMGDTGCLYEVCYGTGGTGYDESTHETAALNKASKKRLHGDPGKGGTRYDSSDDSDSAV